MLCVIPESCSADSNPRHPSSIQELACKGKGSVPEEYVEGLLHDLVWAHVFAGGEEEPGGQTHGQDEAHKDQQSQDDGSVVAVRGQRDRNAQIHGLLPIRVAIPLPILACLFICTQ